MSLSEVKKMDSLLLKQDVIEALNREREYLVKMKMYGAEHILLKHAIDVIEDIPNIQEQKQADRK